MEAKKKRKPGPKGAQTRISKELLNERTLVFGENVRIARKERGFTAEALGTFLGISTAYVGLIERGERVPSMETFLKICEFFGESYEGMLIVPKKLTLAEKKKLNKQEDIAQQILRKQKMISSMINSFDVDELNYLINNIKHFKNFSLSKNASLAAAEDEED